MCILKAFSSDHSFNVSTKEWDDFKGQVEDAISFLRQWEFEISQFALQYPPDLFYLDFPLYSRLDERFNHQGTPKTPKKTDLSVAKRIKS